MNSIRTTFEDFILSKSNALHYDEYAAWIEQYLELSDKDKFNIVTKVERSQSASIMYAMSKKDKEIFINQLGCFYIKPTTTDFYNALDKLSDGKDKSEIDFETIKQSALEQTRDLYIKRANLKKNGKDRKTITFKS